MDPARVENILVASDRLVELDGGRVVAQVLRDDFRGGEIAMARACQRPCLLSVIGVALLVLGAVTARGVIIWLLYGGKHYVSAVMMILLVPGGIWILHEAWRRAPMLLLQTGKGAVRFEFTGPRTQAALHALQNAMREHGYEVRLRPW